MPVAPQSTQFEDYVSGIILDKQGDCDVIPDAELFPMAQQGNPALDTLPQ